MTDSPQIAHAGELAQETLAYVVHAAVALHISATVWDAVGDARWNAGADVGALGEPRELNR